MFFISLNKDDTAGKGKRKQKGGDNPASILSPTSPPTGTGGRERARERERDRVRVRERSKVQSENHDRSVFSFEGARPEKRP